MTVCRIDTARQRQCGLGSLATLTLTLLLALAGGCATQGEKMVESFAETRKTVSEYQRQVDVTLLSLHKLRSTPVPALKDGFNTYKDAVEKLEEQGADAKKRATVLQDRAESHIKAWEAEMSSLKDPTIKSTMDQRRQAVRSNYKLLMLYAQDARKAYGPCLAGNKDVVQALSIDLSPAAIESLSPSIDRVLLDGAALKEKLAAMQHALDNIANGVSPLGEMQ
jgi:hypothetical protein